MKIKAIFLLLFVISCLPGMALAQSSVNINITLRPISQLEMIKEVECTKINRDLLLSLTYETFIVGGPSALSLEPLEINEMEKYYLIKGNREYLLKEGKSTSIDVLSLGSHKNVIKILVKNTKLSSCAKIADKFILTVAPL